MNLNQLIPFTLDNQNQPQIMYPMICQPLPTPHMIPVPMVQPAAPAVPQNLPEGEILQYQVLPKGSRAPLLWNGSTWNNGEFVVPYSQLQVYNQQGERVPPLGYCFVLMNVEANKIPAIEEGGEVYPPSPSLSAATDSGSYARSNLTTPKHSPSISPVNSVGDASKVVFKSEFLDILSEKKPEKKRKFRHRSKQERIMQVHEDVRLKYTAKGLYAGNDEVLRGRDTIRVHVKTYQALGVIQMPLDEVERHPLVTIERIATPFSMKNRFQKKGFIVYMKLRAPEMVPIVQEIFGRYSEHFNKCDLALKKEDKIKMQEAARKAAAAAKEVDPFGEAWTPTWNVPPAMTKRSSLHGA